MLCEKCGSAIESITCDQCGNVIMKLGPFCYSCGREIVPSADKQEADTVDFTERLLCVDGACIGVVEKGVCKICGKPYTSES